MLVFNDTVINITVLALLLHLITGELWALNSDCSSHYCKQFPSVLTGRKSQPFTHKENSEAGAGPAVPELEAGELG